MTRLLWLDLETTGLDPDPHGGACVILEVAAVLTNERLVPVSPWLDQIVHYSAADLAYHRENAIKFVQDMHDKNGLWSDILKGRGTRLINVEGSLVHMVAGEKAAGHEVYIAGNTIHQDVRFLRVHMPALMRSLHYRQFDISALKVAVGMWAPNLAYVKPEGDSKDHRARADLEWSLAEARHYYDTFFSPLPLVAAPPEELSPRAREVIDEALAEERTK